MRTAIDNFFQDKGRNPKSLEELIPNYLKFIPKDPLTGGRWIVIRDESEVIDVKTSAIGKTCDGVPYEEL